MSTKAKKYGDMTLEELEADLAAGNESAALLKALERKRAANAEVVTAGVVADAVAQLEKDLARPPEVSEVAARLGIAEEAVMAAIAAATSDATAEEYRELATDVRKQREEEAPAPKRGRRPKPAAPVEPPPAAAAAAEPAQLAAHATEATAKMPQGTEAHIGRRRGDGPARVYLVKAKSSTTIGIGFADQDQAKAWAESHGWVVVSGYQAAVVSAGVADHFGEYDDHDDQAVALASRDAAGV